MKFVYIILAAALLASAYYFFTAQEPSVEELHNDSFEQISENEMTNSMDESLNTADTSNDSSQASVILDPNAKVFNVTAVNYGFSLKEIRVKEGETVTINFESTDGFHDFVVDEFDAATEKVRPGTPSTVTFIADNAGTFEYYCSVGSHRSMGMVGTLVVE